MEVQPHVLFVNLPTERLRQCPVVKQCDRVAVRRQYAASYGFCFNCGRHNPNRGGLSCPKPPGCSKCPGHHLSLLHKEKNTGHRCRSRRNNDSNGNVNHELIPLLLPWFPNKENNKAYDPKPATTIKQQ